MDVSISKGRADGIGLVCWGTLGEEHRKDRLEPEDHLKDK